MTDTRLPDKWLTDVRYLDLSDGAWRLFTSALMWCNQQGTDGIVPQSALGILRPGGDLGSAVEELVEKQHWEKLSSGFRFKQQWDKQLGQSTSAEVNSKREANRERQRRMRERNEAAENASKHSPNGDLRDVKTSESAVARDVTRYIGQDRIGKDRNDSLSSICAPCRHCGEPTREWNVGGTVITSCEDCLGSIEPM